MYELNVSFKSWKLKWDWAPGNVDMLHLSFNFHVLTILRHIDDGRYMYRLINWTWTWRKYVTQPINKQMTQEYEVVPSNRNCSSVTFLLKQMRQWASQSERTCQDVCVMLLTWLQHYVVFPWMQPWGCLAWPTYHTQVISKKLQHTRYRNWDLNVGYKKLCWPFSDTNLTFSGGREGLHSFEDWKQICAVATASWSSCKGTLRVLQLLHCVVAPAGAGAAYPHIQLLQLALVTAVMRYFRPTFNRYEESRCV